MEEFDKTVIDIVHKAKLDTLRIVSLFLICPGVKLIERLGLKVKVRKSKAKEEESAVSHILVKQRKHLYV